MDTGSLVKSKIIEGRHILERLVASGFDVSAAAWVKDTDSDETWRLYIVSKVVDERGITDAYGEAHVILKQIPDPWAAATEFTLASTDNRVGRSLREISTRFAGIAPVYWDTFPPVNFPALGAFLYPPILPVPPEQQPLTPQELLQKVVCLMANPDVVLPVRIMLQDGTIFLGIPFGVEKTNGHMQVKIAVEGLESSRAYPVDAIRRID